MSYEYKESMKEDLQHLYEIPTGVWKYKEKLEELDEVYAKAQAYDDIMELIEKHSHYTEDFHVDWELVGEELIDLELDDL